MAVAAITAIATAGQTRLGGWTRAKTLTADVTKAGLDARAAIDDGGQTKLGIAHPVGRVGERSPASAGTQVQHPLEVGAAVESRTLDALAVALQHPPADVGVQRRRLDAKEVACLGRAQVCLAVDLDHVSQAYVN